MNNSTEYNLNLICNILIRCFWIGALIIALGFFGWLFAGDIVYQLHSRIFSLTPSQMDLVVYCTLAMIKTMVIIFFLLPWLSIKWYLRTKKMCP